MSKATHALNTSECAAPTRHTSATHYDIKTVTGLIDALGGQDAVAKEFGVTPQSVRAWEINGCIPPGWHLHLLVKMFALGKTISPSVFCFDTDHEVAQGLTDLMRAAHRPEEGGAHG